MKKTIAIIVLALMLLLMGVSTVAAGEGDPQPGVIEPGGICGIDAGPWGVFWTYDWWNAYYSTGTWFLKCTAETDDAPASLVVIKPAGTCHDGYGNLTDDSTVKVFPNGNVSLFCKFR